MKITIGILAICALTACSTPGAGPSSRPSNVGVPLAVTSNTAVNSSFVSMLNAVRAANGAKAVTADARLTAAAQAHANDMIAQNYFSHTGRNGSNLGGRAKAAGYNWSQIAENIARGQTSQSSVLRVWSKSPQHHANNINPAFTHFGLARAGSGSNTRWVLVLGTK